MGRETFEDRIRDKFEGQTSRAPGSAWKNIENSINADLVVTYESQQSFYKWLSVAALFIAVLLLGALLATPFEMESEGASSDTPKLEEGTFYNALLSSDLDYNRYYQVSFKDESDQDLRFTAIAQTPDSETIVKESNIYQVLELNGKKPQLKLADTHEDVYQYYTLRSHYINKRVEKPANSRLWAGVEAGAGTFENNLTGASLSNSLNPAGLANAIGSGNFVNPTTNISQEMGQALAKSIALDLGVQLGERWTLESGIAYTNFDNNGTAAINVLDVFTIDNSNFEGGGLSGIDGNEIVNPGASREATIEVERNYDHEVELNNRIQFASIPLKAGYFVVNKRFSLRLNAGLAANYLVQGNISDPTNQILNSDNLGIYNDWSFDGIGGMEFGYAIFDKFDFTIEPNYRHAITPISNASNDASRFAVQTGLRYTLK